MTCRHEVLVVGGGPAGAACAYWLAEAGRDVLLVEKKRYPREKTCGDGLTPRSVRQLYDMGLADALAGHHRFDGLRSIAFGRTLELRWPDHPDYPTHGYVVTRKDLDQLVAERAEKAGATVWQQAEAVDPLRDTDGDTVAGAVIRRKGDDAPGQVEVAAEYVVVADGANSRFGRALGTSRDRTYPMGMAIRGYYESPRHDEPWIESHLDIRDRSGTVLPGYGWIFPVGDGRVNVGVGLLSTSKRWRSVNTSHLMESFADYAPESWGIRPETSCGPPLGGRLPMAFSLSPSRGPRHLVIGDAGEPSTPSTARASATPTRRGAWPRKWWARPSPPATRPPWPTTTAGSGRSTSCTTRWPGPSCGSSATPR
ncbi:MAG: geranylgeranyl reductase family protein [Acidimicrobiales bacterium]